MQWSPMQERALSDVSEWLRKGTEPVFRLFGYAGTGKTTLAVHLASGVSGRVLYCAFTGKAAHVMQQRGCTGASTIHKLIYKPSEKSKERLQNLMQEQAQLRAEIIAEHGGQESSPECQVALSDNPLLRKLRDAIMDEKQGLKKPAFMLNFESELRHASLLVVDECSMVDEQMAEDMLSFQVPILVLGDPAQLPPVRGTGYFTERDPDVLLTEIHRQAQDNPIIQLATTVREGGTLEEGQYGESCVIGMEDGEPGMYSSHDQVLCGRERKPERADPVWRQNLNRRIRDLQGRKSHLPEPGDKLICLRNNHDLGILNGSMWKTKDSQDLGDYVGLTLEGEDGREISLQAHSKIFRGEEVEFFEMKDAEHFDFGYAMTVHKAQGSQFGSVLLFDQSRIFRRDARRWLYTGITRAAERVTVIRA